MNMRYLLLALLVVFVAGCASPTVDTQSASSPDAHPHAGMHGEDMHAHLVSSEEEFVVEMIPHHQEAVDTSRLVLESTQNADLALLAGEIIRVQEEEIALLEQWLVEHYDGGYEASYQPMMGDLAALEGEARDVAYIQGMIEHHMGAVMMARSVLELDPSSHVESFANEVIEAQSTEIAELNRLLEGYQ